MKEPMEPDISRGCPHAGPQLARLLDLDPELILHQGDVMAALAAADPVIWVPELDAYAVTRYDCVVEALTDIRRFSSQLGDPKGPRMSQRLLAARQELVDKSDEFAEVVAQLKPDWRQAKVLTTADPPRHTRHRQLVNRLFSPRRVAAFELGIRELADDLIDAFIPSGRADLVADFAVGLPLRVVAEQLGVAEGNLADFKRWSDDLVFATGNDRPTSDDIMRMTRSLVEMDQFLRRVIGERRAHPQDDFATLLANAESGDPADPLGDEERVAMMAIMLSAGNETTTKMITAGISILARQPELAIRLTAEPEKIPAFVEETLRLESPLQGIYRIVREDTELGGVHLPAGASIWVVYGAANRSPITFPNQSSVDLDRPNLRDHVAFGHGIHYCVGAPLARLEGTVAFSALLERVYPWTIVSEEMQPSYMLHGHRRLDVTFEPRHLRPTAGPGVLS
jgi:cytochrome P450